MCNKCEYILLITRKIYIKHKYFQHLKDILCIFLLLKFILHPQIQLAHKYINDLGHSALLRISENNFEHSAQIL